MSREIRTELPEKEMAELTQIAECIGESPEALFAEILHSAMDELRVKTEYAQLIQFPYATWDGKGFGEQGGQS